METIAIKKQISINAKAERVWEVLFQDKYTRIWYEEFSKGSYAETDWQQGSKAVFKDSTQNGIVGKIAVNKPYQQLSIEYTGVIKDGVENYTNDEAQKVKGSHEVYYLANLDDHTLLSVECDMPEEYFETMAAAWDKALEKIKDLAESKK